MDTMKNDIVRWCKPWFGIGGSHLKCHFWGILLSVISLNANKEMFPIVIVIVEIKNKDSRMYFLTLLKEALELVLEWKDDSLTIMSYM